MTRAASITALYLAHDFVFPLERYLAFVAEGTFS
jgi:hypothetical protein